YELWTSRRETWLHALPGAEQFEHDRPAAYNAEAPTPRSLSDIDAEI
ncbi:GFA family protein, partial [Mesorhizobium sp. M7A.F.Ca.CA.002.04.1.1]